jgi:hypothetical protein
MKNLFIALGFSDKEKQVKYGKECIFISKLYNKFISDIKIKNLRKIAIELVSSPAAAYVIPTHNLTKVCLVYKYFDWQNLNNEAIEINRYKILLDLISDTILEISEKFNWPVEPFKNAYLEVIKTGFKNEYALLAPKLSKDKRYSASLIVVVNKKYSSIFVELIDKIYGDKITRIELMKIIFYEENLSDITKKLKWISNNEFVVSNKEGEINFKYSIQNNVSETFLTPRIHDEKYLQDELKLLNSETSQAEYLEINNRRIANILLSSSII